MFSYSLGYRNSQGYILHALSHTHTSFLTPARRDGATVILVGDLTNPQREQIYDTLSVPPTQLAKKEFVSWCHDTLGRAHDYTFLAFLKEQKKRQLFLTRAETVEKDDLCEQMAAFTMVGGGGGGGGAYTPAGKEKEEEEEDEGEEEAALVKGDRRRLQGGIHQKGARDLYITNDFTIAPLLPVLQARATKKMKIWEPCVGLGNIASFLKAEGYDVVGTDLFAPDGTFQPLESFID